MDESILVSGGAGYIGSHVVKLLRLRGYEVWVIDNLSTGFLHAVGSRNFIQGDLADVDLLEKTFLQGRFSAVLHFAAAVIVPESVARPLKYYRNNTANTLNLLEAAARHQVPRFIFSSTAAVYGHPARMPVREADPTAPINPYGASKLMSERILEDHAKAEPGLRYVTLRYFNVAGAAADGSLGQNTRQATHLVKVAAQAALGRRPVLQVFGTDYDTPDGTCIRDYIHIDDLASAHLAALEYLEAGRDSTIMNCGYGRGYSVRQVLAAMKKVSGSDFTIIDSGRRPGDPAELVADNARICGLTSWKPAQDDLELICKSALDWERKLARESAPELAT